MSKTYFLIFFVFSLQTLTFSSTSDRVGYTLPIYGPSYDLGRGGKEGGREARWTSLENLGRTDTSLGERLKYTPVSTENKQTIIF